MNEEGFKITSHKPINPFIGKSFKIVTYRGEEELASEAIKIESQIDLKTILDSIKQFNNTQEELLNIGYSKQSLLVKKLITE